MRHYDRVPHLRISRGDQTLDFIREKPSAILFLLDSLAMIFRGPAVPAFVFYKWITSEKRSSPLILRSILFALNLPREPCRERTPILIFRRFLDSALKSRPGRY